MQLKEMLQEINKMETSKAAEANRHLTTVSERREAGQFNGFSLMKGFQFLRQCRKNAGLCLKDEEIYDLLDLYDRGVTECMNDRQIQLLQLLSNVEEIVDDMGLPAQDLFKSLNVSLNLQHIKDLIYKIDDDTETVQDEPGLWCKIKDILIKERKLVFKKLTKTLKEQARIMAQLSSLPKILQKIASHTEKLS